MNKSFRIGDLFAVEDTWVYGKNKQYNSRLDNPTSSSVAVVSGITVNNGINYYTEDILDESEIYSDCLTISTRGEYSGTVFYHDYPFVLANNILVMPMPNLSREAKLYIATLLNKLSYGGYNHYPKKDTLKEDYIELPVIENSNPDHEYTVDDIDWQSIQNFITKLEQDYIAEIKRERIAELDAYLIAAGLDNYELADEDKRIPASSKEVKLGKFSLGGEGGLFNIYSPKKRFNANTVRFGGKYPYVARGSSNNGIRGYITEDEQYLSPAKSLSFGQDTATVYYQPDAYFTGDKIKVMVLNNRELTPELAEYFIAAIAKAFSNFAWGQNSFNESIIKSTKIVLPVKSDGTPDFDYMERYIRVIEKLAIADVVKHKDRMIAAAKQVINI